MRWEDQGRQEHGWFGHGTTLPKVDDGAGADKSEAKATQLDAVGSADAAAAQAYAWAKAYGLALFGLPRREAALVQVLGEAAKEGSLYQGAGTTGDRSTEAQGSVTLVSDVTERGSYPEPPLADALPSSPHAQAFAHMVERLVEQAMHAVEETIGRVFSSEGQYDESDAV